jgi:hypothetical protein
MHLQEIEMELELFRDDGLVLANLTWPEVNEIRDEIELVLVPVGSNEQHGPNLAVQMDSRGAFEFARRASARMAPRLLVAPSVPIGVSHHHMNFPGTVTHSHAHVRNIHSGHRRDYRIAPTSRLRAFPDRQRPRRQHRRHGNRRAAS